MAKPERNQMVLLRHGVLALLVAAAGAAGAQDAGAILLDRAVASVEGQVITLTQLDFEARVLLVNAGAVRAAMAPLDRPALEASLDAIIDQRLATLEADRLDAYPLEPGELERAIIAFRERFASEAAFRAFLDRHEADLSDVTRVLRRSLRAEKALDARLRLRAAVSEREARAQQAQDPRLAGLSVDAVRERLSQERFTRLVREELARLRRETSVHRLGPFAVELEGSR